MDVQIGAVGHRPSFQCVSFISVSVQDPSCHCECTLLCINHTLHNDLKVPFVADLARFRYFTFHNSFDSRNPLNQVLFSPTKAPKNATALVPTVVK